MERYYHWSTQLPKNPDYSLESQDFLKSLLSREDGLVPDISVAEDAELPMLPLGNPQETLLWAALRHAGY